jgi:hypothetical protein
MLSQIKTISLIAGVMLATVSFAQTPASAPAGSTGLCKDWYAGGAAPASGSAPAPTAATPATTPAPAAAPKAAPAPAVTQAPGGGAGQVWVNSSSKVYHCSGDRWYGKTKAGAYMTESEAVAQGNRPDHGKACH